MAKKRGIFDRLVSRREAPDDLAAAFSQMMEDRLARSVFQPLVDLRTRKIFAYEALARCSMEMFRSPPVLFDAAVKLGRVGELGRYLRQSAVDVCTNYPLFLNVHPHEFNEGWLIQPDDPIFCHSEAIYLEITESVPLHYFEQCHSVLAEARSKGVYLAVDDLGAGYSNLKYISDLSPEVVKIDRDLIAGVTIGSRGFRLIKGIVRLCEDMGAKVVAEGIETPTELACVIEAGAHYGQGYLLARPGLPPPEAVWPMEPVTPEEEEQAGDPEVSEELA